MRRAELARRRDLNLTLYLALSAEVARAVFARLVIPRAGLHDRRLKLLMLRLLLLMLLKVLLVLLLMCKLKAIEEVRGRHGRLRKGIHPLCVLLCLAACLPRWLLSTSVLALYLSLALSVTLSTLLRVPLRRRLTLSSLHLCVGVVIAEQLAIRVSTNTDSSLKDHRTQRRRGPTAARAASYETLADWLAGWAGLAGWMGWDGMETDRSSLRLRTPDFPHTRAFEGGKTRTRGRAAGYHGCESERNDESTRTSNTHFKLLLSPPFLLISSQANPALGKSRRKQAQRHPEGVVRSLSTRPHGQGALAVET